MHDKSILETVKQMIGILDDYEIFDMNIIMIINTAFGTLWQLGIGTELSNYSITGPEETWSDIFGEYEDCIDLIIQYTWMKVRIAFDPPTTSGTISSFETMIQELEWRIYMQSPREDNSFMEDLLNKE